ncbi:PIN domain nuclease [Streptomyces radicis]|uniref:Ribonuclease VapC n=1 Tax=Streptomyces radicis TaxID=1750517 RepID=A0A3A9VZB5_9ACTN|nr:PIN domain nuclease [Streptomyces radicis]RKN06288.1 PIN domain nuclease [Streptomyces radicis]RKN18618.1 PIN domain nuclease [Streptomyces radicis]
MSVFLVDKSALARWGKPEVAAVLDGLHDRGLLSTCAVVEYEMVFSARTKKEATRIRASLRGFDHAPCNDEEHERALWLQRDALRRGFHRALSLSDLLIAAVAQRHGLTVLHYDGDFDMIRGITGQPMRWVVRPGTADR